MRGPLGDTSYFLNLGLGWILEILDLLFSKLGNILMPIPKYPANNRRGREGWN
jgi:hypothetical protein